MARLAAQAGLPPGVFNVLHGYGPGSAGAALTEHPGVDRITFTGESGTGRVIARAAAANLVPVSLELGGKGANIVFDDAELAGAVDWSIRAIFGTPARSWFVAEGRGHQLGPLRPSTIRRSGLTSTASRPTAARSAPGG